MSINKLTAIKNLACSLAAFALVGCASADKDCETPKPMAAAPAPAPVVAQPKVAADTLYGPSHSTFDQDGRRYVKGSMGFPTGKLDSSGLLLEKVVPAEVMVGEKFNYTYKVINLTDYPIYNVNVWDRVGNNFRASAADPQPADVNNGVAHWVFDSMEPRGVRTISVTGSGSEEGFITTCGWATYSPILCEPIKVVKADIALTKTGPAEVILCDVIPYVVTVKNTGSSVLKNVQVTDTLPAGLTADGRSSLVFDAGNLAPGESKQFAFNAVASQTGKFDNVAKVKTGEGIEAEAASTTVVRNPVLTIACEAPAERFVGRPIDVCMTVKNTGDAPSAGTIVTLPVPAGATLQGATAGGRLSGNNVVWDLGTVPAGESKEVCATFTGNTIGSLNFSSTAQGACAKPVQSSCGTKIAGIPAILLEVVDLDDPIEVGKEQVYEIVVTNQGSAPATGVRITCELEDSQTYVSTTGETPATANGNVITLAPVPSIPAKGKAVWRVAVKAEKPANVRFKVSMISDQLVRVVEETESTNQY